MRDSHHLTILSPFIVLKNVFKASFPLPLVFSSIFCLLSDSVLKIVPHSWRTKFTNFEQSTYKRRFFEICFYYQTICWDMHLILWTRNIFVAKLLLEQVFVEKVVVDRLFSKDCLCKKFALKYEWFDFSFCWHTCSIWMICRIVTHSPQYIYFLSYKACD